MTKPLKAALIGCGSISQRGVMPHLACADAKSRVQVVAVVDVVPDQEATCGGRWDYMAPTAC